MDRIETARLLLRPFEEGDRPAYRAIRRKPKRRAISGDLRLAAAPASQTTANPLPLLPINRRLGKVSVRQDGQKSNCGATDVVGRMPTQGCFGRPLFLEDLHALQGASQVLVK